MADKTGVAVAVGFYLLFLFAVGIYFFFESRKAGASMESHYVANRSFGPFILLMTLFATVFSGYTVVGTPNDAFRDGFYAFKWPVAIQVLFISMIIIAPRLRELAVARNYGSPTDFLTDRFRSKPLQAIGTFCMMAPSSLYLVAQFKALATTVDGFFDGDFPGILGAAILAVIVLVYESLGGLKSVAFTDAVQGSIMLFGLVALLWVVTAEWGTLAGTMAVQQSASHPFFAAPSFEEVLSQWAWMMGFMSFPLYPTFITRIYAAKDHQTTRLSVRLLPWAPFLTQIPGIVMGLIGSKTLENADPANFFGAATEALLDSGTGAYVVVSVVLAGTLAAIMSTADSFMIAFSNLFVVDIYKQVYPDASESAQLRAGKIASVLNVAVAVAAAALPINLSPLLGLQSGILSQLIPAFYLGLFSDVKSKPIVMGAVAGLVVFILTQVLALTGTKIYISAILWSMVANFSLVAIGQLLFADETPEQERARSTSRWSQPAVMYGEFASVSAEGGEKANKASLNLAEIERIMIHMQEPVFAVKYLVVLQVLLLFLIGPWFFVGSTPGPLYGGLPGWTLYQLTITLLMAATTSIMTFFWKLKAGEGKKSSASVSMDITKKNSQYQLMVN